jgi:AcrR family transcriptional regulator
MSRWKPDSEGRLIVAAITLFVERGYDDTTVAEIAEAAGLTKRTFFRYFSDKREVLFKGSEELMACWIDGVEAAPADAGPMAAVAAGLDRVAGLFEGRHPGARLRSRVVAENPELQERELIKLQTLAGAIAGALRARGVSPTASVLASQAGVTVFHVGFAHWVAQNDPAALGRLMHEALAELRALTATT